MSYSFFAEEVLNIVDKGLPLDVRYLDYLAYSRFCKYKIVLKESKKGKQIITILNLNDRLYAMKHFQGNSVYHDHIKPQKLMPVR